MKLIKLRESKIVSFLLLCADERRLQSETGGTHQWYALGIRPLIIMRDEEF